MRILFLYLTIIYDDATIYFSLNDLHCITGLDLMHVFSENKKNYSREYVEYFIGLMFIF